MVQHAVQGAGRHAGLVEQVAQGLAALHPQHLPAVARHLLLAGHAQRRQRQCQAGVAVGERRVDGVREAGDDRRHQRTDGRKQAGMHPMAPGPATWRRSWKRGWRARPCSEWCIGDFS
ncbi:hypothetical protein G6F55_014094 [Rhizopus delemar]|nr:hypothetical protein G6F55_014094 [Rhizopus delemar]